jgi:TIR domain
MGAPDIFVSYAREDQVRVAPLVAALEARGWVVFWDRRIPAGQTWRSHIGRALEKARCVVVAWSEHAIRSEWVIEEADEGKRREVLVPVFLDAVLPPWGFRGIQAADLSSWSPERPSPDFDSFLADLGAVLGTPQQGPSLPSPAAGTSSGKRLVGDGDDEPTTPRQAAAVDPGGGDGIAGPLAGSMADAPHAAETPAPPAGQPTHAVDASARRELEMDPPPLPIGEERPAEALPSSGLPRPTEAPPAASLDVVLAEQARSRRIGPKSKIGRRGLGMALVVGAISAAGGYAYFGDATDREEDAFPALRPDPYGSPPADPAKTRILDLRGEVLEAKGDVLAVTSPAAEVGKGRVLDLRGGELAVEGSTSGLERRISPY